MNYCFSCGHKTVKDSKFCIACGTRLSEDSERPVGETKTLNSGESKSRLTGKANNKFMAGAVAAIVILFFMFSNHGTGSPAVVAENFIEHSINSEWEKGELLWSDSGIDYLLSELGSEGWIQQSMQNLTHRYYMDSGSSVLYEYEITSEEVDGNEAYIEFDFTFDDGRRERAMFQMVKEEGEWKVFAFNSGV